MLAGCTASGVPASPPPSAPDWRTDPLEPYPFTTPVPPPVATAIDGVYSRPPTDLTGLTRTKCTRCQPYPLDRGSSRLTFRTGRYEVLHEEPRYRGSGHYVVEGERVILFNDPECSETRGVYRWTISEGTLRLEPIDDACAFGQRARDLSDSSWTVDEGTPQRP